MSKATHESAPMDWPEIRKRLTQAALTDGLELSAERARAVMDERARLLAAVPRKTRDAADVCTVVVFALGSERYAMETHFVREVVRAATVTRLPATAEHFAGIVVVRGEILLAVD